MKQWIYVALLIGFVPLWAGEIKNNHFKIDDTNLSSKSIKSSALPTQGIKKKKVYPRGTIATH